MDFLKILFYNVLFSISFFIVIRSVVPQIKHAQATKHFVGLLAIFIFLMVYDGTDLINVLVFYGMLIAIVRLLYNKSSLIASLSVLFIYIIQLFASLITSNLSLLFFSETVDFRLIFQSQQIKSVLIYYLIIITLLFYYRYLMIIMQKVHYFDRDIKVILLWVNSVAYSLLLAYHRVSFDSLLNTKHIQADLNGAWNINHYLIISYLGMTFLLFVMLLIVNRLFIVDYSMANYKHKAETDLMTGALSREAGLQFLQQEMVTALKSNKPLSIGYIDINDLKKVNDVQGHKAGDAMIKHVVDIVKKCIRNDDRIARLGGDEFVVILPSCKKEQAVRVWQQIQEHFNAANQSFNHSYNLSASVGFAEYDAVVHRDYKTFLTEADEKMYDFKKKYKAKAL